MNDVLKVIGERYSCRNYDGRMPEKETLDAIALAAMQAPSAMNLQPWHVTVVANKAVMDELDAEAMAILAADPDKQTMHQRMMERGGKIYYNAPAMFVVWQLPGEVAAMDAGILCQNIALAATSVGLGSVICRLVNIPLNGPGGNDHKAELGCPEGYEFGIAVLVGYATGSGTPHEPDMEKVEYV